MCTYGIACRSIIESICEKDVKRLKRFDCRFSSPVYPGETIITEMWKDENVIHFQSKVKERDKIVIKNGESEVVFINEAGYIAHKENINNISKNEKYIWIHVASLGEYEQGLPVFKKIKSLYKDHKIQYNKRLITRIFL